MERGEKHTKPQGSEYLCHDTIYTYEQVALQALIDKMFEDSDREIFRIFNKMIHDVQGDEK